MTGVAVAFVGVYAWSVLNPDASLAMRGWAHSADLVMWALFVLDYLVRVGLAERRLRYVRQHAFEIVVLILPAFRALRVIRVVRLFLLLSRLGELRLRGQVTFYSVGAAGMLMLLGSLAVLDAERGAPGANIVGFGDALWWAATTVTTVGYGDRYPVSVEGRLVAIVLMVSGIALIGALIGALASWFAEKIGAVQQAELAGFAVQQDLLEEVRALRSQVARLSLAAPSVPTPDSAFAPAPTPGPVAADR